MALVEDDLRSHVLRGPTECPGLASILNQSNTNAKTNTNTKCSSFAPILKLNSIVMLRLLSSPR